jgi:hypothetical protein
MISEIDYDNVHLSALKEGLKIKRMYVPFTMHYKSSTAIMEISGKGKATDVWDNFAHSKHEVHFKLLEVGDNNIIIKQKN